MTVPKDLQQQTPETKSFLDEIDTLQTQFEVFRLLKRVCDAFGFSAFMVTRMPETSHSAIADCAIINNWPTDMIAGYDELSLLRTSPMIRRMRASTRPMMMSLAARTAASPASEREASEALFRRFGFLMGVAIPVHDPRGQRGAVFFEGDREDPCHIEMLELNMLGIHVYEQLTNIAGADRSGVNPLTERETHCLIWTAEGKTSVEIAEILGLSEHTVNHYLNRAAKKLGSVNRTQAVAKALRRGWID